MANRCLYLCFIQWVRAAAITKKKGMKRVNINGMTGSRWWFKRFERLSVIFTLANIISAVLS